MYSMLSTSGSDDGSLHSMKVKQGGGAIQENAKNVPRQEKVDQAGENNVDSNEGLLPTGLEKGYEKGFEQGLAQAVVSRKSVLGNYVKNVHAMGTDISVEIRCIHDTITPVMTRCNSSDNELPPGGEVQVSGPGQRQGQGLGYGPVVELGLASSLESHGMLSNSTSLPPMSTSLSLSQLNNNHVCLCSSVGMNEQQQQQQQQQPYKSTSHSGGNDHISSASIFTPLETTTREPKDGVDDIDDSSVGMAISFSGTFGRRPSPDASFIYARDNDDDGMSMDMDHDIDDDNVSDLLTPCTPCSPHGGTPNFRNRKVSLSPTTLAVVMESLTHSEQDHRRHGHVENNNQDHPPRIENVEQWSSLGLSLPRGGVSIPSTPTRPLKSFAMENHSQDEEDGGVVPMVKTNEDVSFHTCNDDGDDGDDDDDDDGGEDDDGDDDDEDDDDDDDDDDDGSIDTDDNDVAVTKGMVEIVANKYDMVKPTPFSSHDFANDNASETTVGGDISSQPSVVTITTQRWRT